MDTLSPEEMLEHLDLILSSLEINENVYYIALDLIHQAREEISRVTFDDEDEE